MEIRQDHVYIIHSIIHKAICNLCSNGRLVVALLTSSGLVFPIIIISLYELRKMGLIVLPLQSKILF